MHVEVSVALNFVISYLYNKLPRRWVDLFGEELEKKMKKKFEGHWYPDRPAKGSGFRCIRVNGEKIDPDIERAAIASGLDIEEIKTYLPADLTLWIDPSEVSYRISEKGCIKILYSDKKDEEPTDTFDREVQAVSKGFNPEAQCFKPIESMSSSLSSLSLSPSSPTSPATWSNSTSPSGSLFNSSTGNNSSATATVTSFLAKQTQVPRFTAASFAQTKFGSTKLKSQVKRPTRLSPTEFGNYFRQRTASLQTSTFSSPTRPRSLSPRDPRLEFFVDQQQRLSSTKPQRQRQHSQSNLHHHHQHQQQQQPGLLSDFYQHTTSSSSSFSTNMSFPDSLPTGISPVNSFSPETHKSFMDGISNLGTTSYPNQFQHLLVAN